MPCSLLTTSKQASPRAGCPCQLCTTINVRSVMCLCSLANPFAESSQNSIACHDVEHGSRASFVLKYVGRWLCLTKGSQTCEILEKESPDAGYPVWKSLQNEFWGRVTVQNSRSFSRKELKKYCVLPKLCFQACKDWGAVKELKLSYYIGETLLFTIYTHYGNLI